MISDTKVAEWIYDQDLNRSWRNSDNDLVCWLRCKRSVNFTRDFVTGSQVGLLREAGINWYQPKTVGWTGENFDLAIQCEFDAFFQFEFVLERISPLIVGPFFIDYLFEIDTLNVGFSLNRYSKTLKTNENKIRIPYNNKVLK